MCGIAGFVGNFDPGSLGRMNALIAHRGPDDADTWFDPQAKVGLAHRRLSIIDLSPAGRQPMWDINRKAVIVFNGEIYNYRELARDLQRDGFQFKNATDTEVILNLYLRDGERCLESLNGMFAFALWDAEKKRLLVARDGAGVKPLYYFSNAFGFAFASELKALCCLPELDRKIDPVAISHYLTYLYCPAPRTPLAGVLKLEPGTALWVEGGRVLRQWSHWRLPVSPAVEGRSVPELQEELESLLSRALRRQMVADVPVGAFLSGGLDSSSLVSLGRKYGVGHRMDCFTISTGDAARPAEGFANDLPYAKKVAEHCAVPLHIVQSGSEMTADFEKMVYQLDEPQPDPAALHVLHISRLARQQGIKVLLSGAGGDDIFSGYRRHHALGLERLWGWHPVEFRRLIGAMAKYASRSSPAGRRIAKAFQFADQEPERRIAGYFAWLAPEVMQGLLSPDYRRAVAGLDPLSPLLLELASLPKGLDRLDQMLHLDQRFFLPDHNLNYTDKMAMAAGVEVRVPFLDPELMAFAATIPSRFKQRGAIGKWIFKKTMETHLPHDVVYRTKSGFGAPLRHWMAHELKPYFDDTLAESSLGRRGLFDPQAVRALMHDDRLGRIDALYPLFGLVCIEMWCRQFLDHTPKA